MAKESIQAENSDLQKHIENGVEKIISDAVKAT